MKQILVKKRNGKTENFDLSKITKVIEWAINGYTGVSPSDIEINANINIHDGIRTEEIHKLIIESAANLISVNHPNYQYVAARLLNYQLRKDVWGGKHPPRLKDFLHVGVKKKIYDSVILEKYSDNEINKIGENMDHDRDYIFTYAGIKQLCDKYLIKDRVSGEIHETPQFAYMLISMTAFMNYPEETRMEYVCRFYNAISKHKINLPTPVMAGLRTSSRNYASCCLIGVDDTKDSITSSATAVSMATANRCGIGIDVSRIRAAGSAVKNGEVVHTGLIPFLKIYEASVKAWQQNGLRGGSATCNIQWWHYEIEDIVVLKNNAGTDDNRVRKLDYTVGMSKLFYERVRNNEEVTLFSPHEVPELFEAWGTESFDKVYKEHESRRLKVKKKISARKLFGTIIKERVETGRIYILNVDNANEHGAWTDKITMSNLCLTGDTEITAIIESKNELQRLTVIKLEDLVETFENNKSLKIHVLSKNHEKGTIEFKEVTAAKLMNHSAEIMEITDSDTGKSIQCTPEHKIYTKNRGYVMAKHLNEEDILEII